MADNKTKNTTPKANSAKPKTSTSKVDSQKDKEIADLKGQLATMQEQMQNFMETMQNMQTAQPLEKVEATNTMDYYKRRIPVISFCLSSMTLSTEGLGKGAKYEFDKFGQKKNIPAEHLEKIVESNKSFVEDGYFFICDEDFVKSLYLEEIYQNIFNYDQIKVLVDKPELIPESYKLLPTGQKKLVIDLLTSKILSGEQIDNNILILVSELSGVDLMDRKALAPSEG